MIVGSMSGRYSDEADREAASAMMDVYFRVTFGRGLNATTFRLFLQMVYAPW